MNRAGRFAWILTHDGHLDRRIAAYVEPLREMGLRPVIFAGPGEERAGFLHVLRPAPEAAAPSRWRKALARRLRPVRDRVREMTRTLRLVADVHLPARARRAAGKEGEFGDFVERVYDYRPILRRCERALASGEAGPPAFVLACDLPALPAAHTLARRFGAPLAIDCHEWWAQQARLFLPDHPEAEEAADRHERELYPRCALRITVGDALAAAMASHVRAPFETLHSASPPPPQGARERRLLHRLTRLPESTRIALFQGSLTPLRNLEVLVRSARELIPGQALVLVGDGSERDGLERLARDCGCADRVRFAGWIDQANLMAHAASAEVALLPYAAVNGYYAMSCPNKLFEYLAARLPIVYDPSMLEIDRLAGGAGVGVAASAREPVGFGRAVADLLCDEERLRDIREAYARSGDRFLAAAQKGKIKSLFARLLRGAPRA